MKMSSWIFLVISGLLIISGIFLCNYARDKAPSDAAIDGYTTSEDGQSFAELDYSEQRISNITLDLSDCNVEVRGGADEAKVELIGFKPNSYIGNVTNKTIKVSNQISIMDYFSLDGSGVSFAGVWRTLLSLTGDQEETEPTVIVYVPEDQAIKQYNLTFTNCNVSVVNISGKSEINLDATSSTVGLNKISASLLDLTCDDTELSVLNATADHVTCELGGGNTILRELVTQDIIFSGKEGSVNLIKADFAELEMKMTQCELSLETVYNQGSYVRKIEIEDGEVYLGSLLLGNEDESAEDAVAPGKITIKLEEGKVVTKYGEQQLVVEEEEKPTTEEPSTSEPATGEATGEASAES